MSLTFYLHKKAAPAHVAVVAPEVSMVNNEVRGDAMDTVRRLGFGAAGLGAGAAGLIALKNWLMRPRRPSADIGVGPSEIDLAYPQFEGADVTPDEARGIRKRKISIEREKAALDITYTDPKTKEKKTEDHEKLAARLAQQLYDAAADSEESRLLHNTMVDKMQKFAAVGDRVRVVDDRGREITTGTVSYEAERTEVMGDIRKNGGSISGMFPNRFIRQLDKHADAPQESPGLFSGRWLGGESHMKPTAMPWFLPAVTLGSLGGLAGGASLVSWLAKRRRKAEEKADVAAAKKEYEEAMMSQYSPMNTHRLLAPKEASSLDQIFDRCEKAGATKRAGGINDLLGTGTGAYLTLASLLGLGTGYGTYKYLQSRSKSKQLEQALKDRAALRATQNPPEMFIHPVAVRRRLQMEPEPAVSP